MSENLAKNSSEKARKLTLEERNIYQRAVIDAVDIVPVFRDVIALMRPFYDPSAQTAYTDRFSRVGLSKWFFNEITQYQRAGVILHECMHVLNNHFARNEAIGNMHPTIFNLSGDFEINCGLDKLKKADISMAVFPDKDPYNFERYLSMEQYFYALGSPDSPICPTCGGLKDRDDHKDHNNSSNNSNSSGASEENNESSQNDGDTDGSGSDSSSSGSSGNSSSSSEKNNGNNVIKCPECGHDAIASGENVFGGEGVSCDNASDERSEAADEAGIDRASNVEQSIAKANTNSRIVDELKKKRTPGSESLNDFLEVNLKFMQPAKVSWRNILRSFILKSSDNISKGRSDYSYRRINRRTSESEFIFPGMVKYDPSIMFGVDTSGSMSKSDYQVLLSEIESIIKTMSKGKNNFKVFSVDTSIKKITPVSKVKDIKFQGGGGTDMSVAIKYINKLSLRDQPDIFILATDAGTDWNSYIKELKNNPPKFKNIILVTDKDGMSWIPEELKNYVKIIDISDK